MIHQSAFLSAQHHQITSIDYPTPRLSADIKRHELESGIFTNGPMAGQAYKVVILHPQDAAVCHAVSATQVAREQELGIQNVKPRTEKQIYDNMRFNPTPPDAQKGGLVIGLHTADNQLLAMGGVLLVNEQGDGGRGADFSRCPIDRQVVLNMGITPPPYQGMNLTGLIFPHRLNIAQSFDRDYVVTKVAGKKTKEFYRNKIGFEQDGHDHILPDVAAPNNCLATLGMNMRDVTQWLADHAPHVLAQKIDLHSLYANHKKPQRCDH